MACLREGLAVTYLINIIHLLSYALTLAILADVIVSYFLDPYHPVRRFLDVIVQPMLTPIRRVLPPTGMVDFSPLVLILFIQLIEEVLIRLLLV